MKQPGKLARTAAVMATALVMPLTAGAAAGAAGAAVRAPAATATSPGAQLWADFFGGPGDVSDSASSVAVSPSGATVYVTGSNEGSGCRHCYATVAYNAHTGARLWVQRYNGGEYATSLAVSPSGATVYVTGYSGAIAKQNYVTVAYNAHTGARLWARRYNGPANGADYATSVAVSPSGAAVYVTGQSEGTTSGQDYATIAYNASTGAQLWVQRYNGPGNGYDAASSVAVSPTGAAVYVTGGSEGATSGEDYATVAYNASTGAQLWAKRYNGPGNGSDGATSVAVSPGGATVYVTGGSKGTTSGEDYATIAYDASTGTARWIQRYNGPGNGDDAASSVAVSPGGAAVYVTGGSTGATSGSDYATVAYAASTGAQLWAKRYNGPANGVDVASAVAVSPSGATVYVTGTSAGIATGLDYATIAYDASTGTARWIQRYDTSGDGEDIPNSMAVSPSGAAVYVTGASEQDEDSVSNYLTVAYRG